MHWIQIDQQVYDSIARRTFLANLTPNDVLRQILQLSTPIDVEPPPVPKPTGSSSTASSLNEFLTGKLKAIDRYLAILEWLHARESERFAQVVLGFQCGTCVYFAMSQAEVERSGKGATAKPIPGSPFWALTKLGNPRKKSVVTRLLRSLGYPHSEINLVLAELPGKGIRLRHA